MNTRVRPSPSNQLLYDVVVTMARTIGRDDGLRVRRDDGTLFEAELAGWDPNTALAVLRVPGLGTSVPGFLAHAALYRDAVARGVALAPAKSIDQMGQVIINDYVDAGLAILFMLVVISMVIYGIQACLEAWRADRPTTHEAPAVLAPAAGD